MNPKVVVSKQGIADCRAIVAFGLEEEAKKISRLIASKRNLSASEELELRERRHQISEQAKWFRSEERRFRFSSKIFGDSLLISPFEKNQAVKDEVIVLESE